MISETLRTWLLGIIAAGMVIGVLYALLPLVEKVIGVFA